MLNITSTSLIGPELQLLRTSMALELESSGCVSDDSIQNLKEFADYFKTNNVFQNIEDSFELLYGILESYVSRKTKDKTISIEVLSQNISNSLQKFSDKIFVINIPLYCDTLRLSAMEDFSSRLNIANNVFNNVEDLFCILNKPDILSHTLKVFLLSETLEIEKIKTLSNLLKIAITEKSQNSIYTTLREARK